MLLLFHVKQDRAGGFPLPVYNLVSHAAHSVEGSRGADRPGSRCL
jgi:hypothetical protein